ncbi:MAG: Crp/Fnr family transcriptional regulator [Cyclobacteriaceae bacterium]|nr:Crp/Fnr family transcriptional regulator [Cyclobacteriaceae bacterium]
MQGTESNLNQFRNHLDQFSTLSDLQFKVVVDHIKIRKLKKHEVLLHEDQVVDHTFWINKGLLISTFTQDDGREHIIQFAIENCWITDQQAYYNQERSKFRITCLEDAEVFALSYESRETLCAEIGELSHFFRRKANDSFVKLQQRLLTYLTSDAQQRFELLCEEYPTLIQRISKKRLAAYLGVTRETLSRFTRS